MIVHIGLNAYLLNCAFIVLHSGHDPETPSLIGDAASSAA
jgi:hypothetical protein